MTQNLLAIIIPAFNEAETISTVISKVRACYSSALIIVVDDGSCDDTAEIAQAAGAIVISHIFNMGYGAAIHTGLTYAFRAGSDIVVTMDADGQHEPSEIVKLLRPVQNGMADVCIGSRFLPESERYNVPVVRRTFIWIFAYLTSILARQRISDPTSGFQCMSRKVLKLYVDIPDFPDMYPDADMLLFIILLGCRLIEVPVKMLANETGKSMHGELKSLLYVPKMLIAMIGIVLGRNYLRKKLLFNGH